MATDGNADYHRSWADFSVGDLCNGLPAQVDRIGMRNHYATALNKSYLASSTSFSTQPVPLTPALQGIAPKPLNAQY